MLVLKQTSPKTSPEAPKARPSKTVPSARASLAGRLIVRTLDSWVGNGPDKPIGLQAKLYEKRGAWIRAKKARFTSARQSFTPNATAIFGSSLSQQAAATRARFTPKSRPIRANAAKRLLTHRQRVNKQARTNYVLLSSRFRSSVAPPTEVFRSRNATSSNPLLLDG